MASGWAASLIRNCLGLRPGESFLALSDPPLRGAAEALCAAASRQGAGRAEVLLVPTAWAGGAQGRPPLRLVSARLPEKVGAADGIISLLTELDLAGENPVMRAAMAAFAAAGRGRWAMGAGITTDLMEQGLAADPSRTRATALRLAERLAGAEEVRVTTEAGTDLRLRLGGRPVHAETGVLEGPGALCNLPAGEAYVAPLEESAEGRLVVDLSLGDLPLDGPVTLLFRQGRAVQVEGGEAARLLQTRLGDDPAAWTVGELGLGANAALRVRGRAHLDEKVWGTAHVALGGNLRFGGRNNAVTHYDCVIGAPRLLLDGRVLELGQ